MLLADYPISNWRDACNRLGTRAAHERQVKMLTIDRTSGLRGFCAACRLNDGMEQKTCRQCGAPLVKVESDPVPESPKPLKLADHVTWRS